MREDDLRTLLADRVAETPEHIARLAAVRRLAARMRHRRAAVLASVAALLVCVPLAWPRLIQRLENAADRPHIRAIDDLPEYTQGGRLIGHAVLRTPDSTATITVTPTTYDLFYGSVCAPAPTHSVAVSVSTRHNTWVNSGFECAATVAPLIDVDPSREAREQQARRFGVILGRPIMFTVRVSGHPPGTTVAVGIWAAVPQSEYPWPPRPRRVLPPPDIHWPPQPTTAILPVPGAPNARLDRRITVSTATRVTIGCSGPGTVEVRVNGVYLMQLACWDYSEAYQQGGIVPDLATRAPVGQATISVQPRLFTDPAWRVDVGPVD